tara:strand:- start:265 stop:561 length:297 start_codon:yes stop_codon:yes gene_type:complete
MANWSIYLVKCRDDSLYAGIALDVEKRMLEHQGGKRGAKYLRGRGPLTLAFSREVGERGLALRVEARIKKLSRKAKLDLVKHPGKAKKIISACRDQDS